MKRPNFSEIKSYEEFEKYYWYREELQTICKALGLEYNTGKSELNRIIKAYFEGEKIIALPNQKVKAKTDVLKMDTSLLDCGFTFGNKFREFYKDVTGEENFKFTADMVATVKEVKKRGDKSFTLGDLLDIKLGKKEYVKYDKSSCQWNKFVQDFCADENNNQFKDKIKVASKFWSLLRDSNLPKVYTRDFIENNKSNIDFNNL